MAFATEASTLGYGLLAVALYASDMPDAAHPSAEEITRYAQEGIAALGGMEALRQLHDHLLALNELYIGGELSESDYFAARARQWRTSRLERCLALALERLLSNRLHDDGAL